MPSKAIITGSAGLVGFAAASRLLKEGWQVTGIDDNQRAQFFGEAASTKTCGQQLMQHQKYKHEFADIRYKGALNMIFERGADLILHCAAQPSHDWAATHILDDWGINAQGTLYALEAWRTHCPKAAFCHISTSKVYGDNPNKMTFMELPTRWEPRFLGQQDGISESFPVDNCLHSFFGCSKLAGDMLAQEYGKNFGLPVGIFRPGCIVGSHQKGVEQHGFLRHLSNCVKESKTYKIIGYAGKQVRCNVHADDLVEAMLLFAANPRPGEVYNIGGRGLDCSIREALNECAARTGRMPVTDYVDTPRRGDHIWYVSDTRKLQRHYDWKPQRTLASIFDELCQK